MFRSLWFHNLLALRSRSVRRRQASQNRRRVQIQFEGLEDRITPAPIPLSAATVAELQADINIVNTPANLGNQYTITLTSSSYDLNELTSQANPTSVPPKQLELKNTGGVTIDGNGATLDAANLNRLFQVDVGAKLTLEDMTLQGGQIIQNAPNSGGGAILLGSGGAATLTLSGVTVQNNAVYGKGTTAQGGGIFMLGNSTLNITNSSHIDNNQAIGSTAHSFRNDAKGGGLYISAGTGTVSVTDSTISDNTARGGLAPTASVTGGTASGGGMYVVNGGAISVKSSTMENDKALGGDGTGAGANGGNARGGAMFLAGGGSLSITGSTLNSNKATGGNGGVGAANSTGGHGGYAQGGGVEVTSSRSLTIASSSFSTNTAQGGSGGFGGSAGTPGTGGNGGNGGYGKSGKGGALYDTSTGGLTIKSSSFSTNTASGGAGGGGATGATGANGGNGGNGGNSGYAQGGAAYLTSVNGPTVNSSTGPLILNSSFTDNKAIGGNAGDGGNGANGTTTNGGQGGAGGSADYAVSEGGAIRIESPNALTMINTTLGANSVLGGNAGTGGKFGTGPVANGTQGADGTAGSVQGGGLWKETNANLINDTIARNQATAGSGGTVVPTAKGGGVFSTLSNSLMINDILQGNQATNGPDMFTAQLINLSSSNDFIGNTGGIATPLPTTGMILNNSTPQLAASLSVAGNGTSYYAQLAGASTINAGSNAAVSDWIADAEGVTADLTTDQIGAARVVPPLTPSGIVDMGVVEFNAATATVNFAFAPPSLSVPQGSTSVDIFASVTNGAGTPLSTGSVTFTVLQGSTPVGTPVTVGVTPAGTASTSYTLPANLAPGSYTVQAIYKDASGTQIGDPGSEPLTITPVAQPTNMAPVNVSTTFNSGTQTVNVVVSVTSPSGDVDEGGVTLTVLQGSTVVAVGLGNVTGNSATVALNLPASQATGVYTVQQSYSDGTAFSPTTATGQLTITPATATMVASTLTSTIDTSATQVSVTATLSSTSPVTTGKVTFVLLNGSTPVPGSSVTADVSGGEATANLPIPGGTAAGSYTIQATYSDATNSFTVANPATTPLTIIQATATMVVSTTTPTISASSASQPVPVTATLTSTSGTVDTGSVTFALFNSSNVQVGASTPPVNVSNTGTASTTLTVPGGTASGSYNIKATYSDPSNTFTAAPATTPLTISKATTTTTVSVTTTPPLTEGQLVSVLANVSNSSTVNTGSVSFAFFLGTTQVGSAVTGTVNASGAATAQLTAPAAGDYTLKAVYTDASGVFDTSTGTTSVTIAPSTQPTQPTTPSQPTAPAPTPLQAAFLVAIDVAALLLQGNPSAIAQLGTLSHVFLGVDLPLSPQDIFAQGQTAFYFAGPLGNLGVQAGVAFAEGYLNTHSQT